MAHSVLQMTVPGQNKPFRPLSMNIYVCYLQDFRSQNSLSHQTMQIITILGLLCLQIIMKEPNQSVSKRGFCTKYSQKALQCYSCICQVNGLPRGITEFGASAAARVVVRLSNSTGSYLLHGVAPQPTLLRAGAGSPGLLEKPAPRCT